MSGLQSPERETLPQRYHRLRQEGGRADAQLTLALQLPEYRADAHICLGIDALQQQELPRAFLHLAIAADLLAGRTDVRALLAHVVATQGQAALATAVLMAAVQQFPTNPDLRLRLWDAQAASMSSTGFRQQLMATLPDLTDPAELAVVLDLLAKAATDDLPIGVVHYHPGLNEIRGWLFDPRPAAPLRIAIEANDRHAQVTLDHPSPLLTQAGLTAGHGDIRIQLPAGVQCVNVKDASGKPLLGSPLTICAPLVVPPALEGDPANQPVDVLIPVYEGLAETLECVESAVRARKLNRTRHRLVVLDDASPNRPLSRKLQALAAKGKIVYQRRPANLGFIRNMNRGMTLHPESDVVWLNADTRVHGDWLDRLRAAAYGAADIATATPLTNNGELMSFPQSRVSHPMPGAAQQAELDGLARQLDMPAEEIETGCGFCLFIRRRALEQVGYLDEQELLRGYGEETDWCIRARALGWRHVGALNLFVAHKGGVSFGAEKPLRVQHNNDILRRRYPDAEERFEAFCRRDPLHNARTALQRAALAKRPAAKPGDDELLVDAETDSSCAPSLSYRNQGHATAVTLRAQLGALPLALDYQLPADQTQLVQDLASLHLASLRIRWRANLPRTLMALLSLLRLPYSIECLSDTLLQAPDQQSNTFAAQATHLYLPNPALLARYQAALPHAHFLTQPAPQPKPKPASAPVHALLIADALDKPTVLQRWLEVARQIKRQALPVILLLIDDTSALASLRGTGACHLLPEVAGLSQTQSLLLCGCNAAVSLDDAPGANWTAAELAAHHDLPLYAPPSEVALTAGAFDLAELPLADSPFCLESQP